MTRNYCLVSKEDEIRYWLKLSEVPSRPENQKSRCGIFSWIFLPSSLWQKRIFQPSSGKREYSCLALLAKESRSGLIWVCGAISQRSHQDHLSVTLCQCRLIVENVFSFFCFSVFVTIFFLGSWEERGCSIWSSVTGGCWQDHSGRDKGQVPADCEETVSANWTFSQNNAVMNWSSVRKQKPLISLQLKGGSAWRIPSLTRLFNQEV